MGIVIIDVGIDSDLKGLMEIVIIDVGFDTDLKKIDGDCYQQYLQEYTSRQIIEDTMLWSR